MPFCQHDGVGGGGRCVGGAVGRGGRGEEEEIARERGKKRKLWLEGQHGMKR